MAPVAIVVYREGSTGNALLWRLAHELMAEGRRLAGAVQENRDRDGRCKCDMILRVLPDGPDIAISQELGPHSRGCRLDSPALEGAAGLVERAIGPETELVVLNKFGKQECEGGGLRSAIVRGLDLGKPVLIGVAEANLPALRGFVGDLAEELAPEMGALRRWFAAQAGGAVTALP